jgi:hypothetical protein
MRDCFLISVTGLIGRRVERMMRMTVFEVIQYKLSCYFQNNFAGLQTAIIEVV